MRFRRGGLEYHDDDVTQERWRFPEPLGQRTVISDFTMADVVTIPSQLSVPDVRTHMTVEAAGDLANEDTLPPQPVDALGRSDQIFVVDVVVRADGVERRATARGQDIYAVSALMVVQAVQLILTGRTRTTGVASAGAMFDAEAFLRALDPHLSVELPAPEQR